MNHSGAAIFGGVTQLAVITFIAAKFGPIAFGKLALFMSVAQIFTFLTTLNLAGYSVSIASLRKRLRFACTLTTNSLIVSITAFAGLVLFHLLPNQKITDPKILMPLYVLFQAVSAIVFSLHIASERTQQAAISYISRPFFLFFITTTLSHFSNDAWILIVGIVFAELSTTALLFFTLPVREKRLVTRFKLKDWHEDWKNEYNFYLSAGLGAYLSNLAGSIPNIFGGHLFSPQLFGKFALSQRLAQAPIVMIGVPVCSIANRAARQMRETEQAIDGFVRKVYAGSLTAATVIFFLFWSVLTLGQGLLPAEWHGLSETAAFVFVAGAFQFATATIGFIPLLLRHVKFLIIWSSARIASVSAIALYIYMAEESALRFLFGYTVIEILMSLFFLLFFGRSKEGRLQR